jgi:hypothetical protein
MDGVECPPPSPAPRRCESVLGGVAYLLRVSVSLCGSSPKSEERHLLISPSSSPATFPYRSSSVIAIAIMSSTVLASAGSSTGFDISVCV